MTRPLVLWNAALWTEGRADTHGRFAVTVVDGVVARVTESGGDPPEGALDVDGRTVMPGLVDAHNHVMSDVLRSPGFGPPPELHGESPRPREVGYFVLANAARDFLRGGITTVRDVGSYDDEAIVLGVRWSSAGRRAADPVMRPDHLRDSARRRIFGTMYREADGPWEMRKAVREQIRAAPTTSRSWPQALAPWSARIPSPPR